MTSAVGKAVQVDQGQQANVLDKLDGLFEWAKTEPRIGGFVGWHYRNRTGNMAPGCPCDMRLGAEAMPAVVQKLAEIGPTSFTSPLRSPVPSFSDSFSLTSWPSLTSWAQGVTLGI